MKANSALRIVIQILNEEQKTLNETNTVLGCPVDEPSCLPRGELTCKYGFKIPRL